MNSTTKFFRKRKGTIFAIAFWLLIWQIVSICLKSDILLVSPIKVVKCLGELIVTSDFWRAVGFSFVRIIAGFLIALILGIIFATISYDIKPIREFIELPLSVIKVTPVASFIILVLIWIPSKNLSVFISFLMAFPVFYTNIFKGLSTVDDKMKAMADVFRLPISGQIRYIYIPGVIPFFKAACSLALSFSWKAGIAAEIIGLPRGSMGERLYEAKIYLNTDRMFAWTVTIIVISVVFEKIVGFAINKAMDRLEGR